MDLVKKYAPQAAGLSISQYCPPRCFELAGKRFEFVLDTGEDTGDAVLDFTGETEVSWSIKGGSELKTDKYECRKADDRTYLISYCLSSQTPRENHTWVIDRDQGLVTFLRCSLGENPLYPYLINSHFSFGVITEEEKEHPDRRRHGFTDDVTGTGVKWVYGHKMATVHVYYNTNWYRIGYPKDRKEEKEAPDPSISTIREAMKKDARLRRAGLLRKNQGRHVPRQRHGAEHGKDPGRLDRLPQRYAVLSGQLEPQCTASAAASVPRRGTVRTGKSS